MMRVLATLTSFALVLGFCANALAGPSVFKLVHSPCSTLLNSSRTVPSGTEVALVDDDFKGIHDLDAKTLAKGYPKLDQVFNFRTNPEKTTAGFAQPSENGIISVLKSFNAGPQGSKDVLFFDLREEPVLFVDGKPYDFRSFSHPSLNLFLTGISPEKLDLLEQSMKSQILEAASRNGGKIIIRHEVGPAVELEVDEFSLKTTHETFEKITAEGYRVKFERVPITDQNSPELSDVESILNAIEAHPQSARTFHCHFGFGRTTTGLVISALHDHAVDLVATPAITDEIRAIPKIKAFANALGFTDHDFQALDAATTSAGFPLDLRADLLEKRSTHSSKYPGVLKRYLTLMATAKYLEKPRTLRFTQWIHSQSDVAKLLILSK